jgi:cyclopropane fatty-acyl-phospholipid synthase-like methyltransferase
MNSLNAPQREWWEDFFHGIALDLWRQCITDEQTQSEASFIQKTLQLSSGTDILDTPCGGGRLALELVRRVA